MKLPQVQRIEQFVTGPAALPVCGVALELCLIGIALAGDLRPRIHLLWVLGFPAFICYGVAGWRAVRTSQGHGLRQILVFAIIFRLTMLCASPNLSDDVYRYLWDGRVQLAGVNPYQHAPDSAPLADLRDDELYPPINHKQIRTIYPPVAQLFFAAVCLIDPSVLFMKIVLVGCEMAMLFVLLKILALRGLSRERLLLYAWNPLAILEIAGSGHVDALAVTLLLGAIYLLLLGRNHAGVALLGTAVLSKLVPLLAVPLFWRHMAGCNATVRTAWLSLEGKLAMIWLPIVLVAGYAIYAGAGASHILDGLNVYLMKWRFNDGLFTLVYELLRKPGLPWDDDALEQARVVCSLALIGVALVTLIRIPDTLRAAFILLAAHLLLSPTLHPWYLLWVLPFLPFFPNIGWLYLSAATLLAYNVLDGFQATGEWHEDAWVKWVQYAPFTILMALPRLTKPTR